MRRPQRLLLLASFVSACGGRVTFSSDAACPPCGADEVCAGDTCATLSCSSDSECPAPVPYCRDGLCAATECADAGDCGYGLLCESGSCTEPECEAGGDCAALLVCRAGRCGPAFELYVPEQTFARASCPGVTTNAVAWTEFDPDYVDNVDPPRPYERLVVQPVSGPELSYSTAIDGIIGNGAEINETHLRTGPSIFRIDVTTGLLMLTDEEIFLSVVRMAPGTLVDSGYFATPQRLRYFRTSADEGVQLVATIELPEGEEVGLGWRTNSRRALWAAIRGLCFMTDSAQGFTYDVDDGLRSFPHWGRAVGCNEESYFTVLPMGPLGPLTLREYDWSGTLTAEHPPVLAYGPIGVGDRFVIGLCADVEDAMCAFEPATGRTYYVAPAPPPPWMHCPATYGGAAAWLYEPVGDEGGWAQIHIARFVAGQ